MITPIRQTLKDGEYDFIRKDESKGYLLRDKLNNKLEWWVANKGHASYGLKFRGTDLEFASTADDNEAPF